MKSQLIFLTGTLSYKHLNYVSHYNSKQEHEQGTEGTSSCSHQSQVSAALTTKSIKSWSGLDWKGPQSSSHSTPAMIQ